MNKHKVANPPVGSINTKLETIRRELRLVFGVPERKALLPDPLDLLIATILSQNTNDINSHRAYTNLKKRFPNFMTLSKVKPSVIENLIRVGGIAKRKSKVISKVVSQLESEFPDFRRRSLAKVERNVLIAHLCRLDGVGYKTAACVSLFALGDDNAFPVDTHIHRILNRVGVLATRNPDQTYETIRDSVPDGVGYELHLNLIKFGRKVCTAVRPRCFECPIYARCGWEKKTRQTFQVPPKAGSKKIDFMHLEEV